MIDSTNIKQISENIRKLGAGMKKNALPTVDSEDAGKGLIVSDEGEWVADDLPSELPDVDSEDVGKVLTVNSSGEWDAELPQSGSDLNLDYSETEVKTGFKFMGSDVYRKCIKYSNSSEYETVSGYIEFTRPENMNVLINATLIMNRAYDSEGWLIDRIKAYSNYSSNIRIDVNGSYGHVPGNGIYLLIDYTKTAQNAKKTKKG